MEETTIQSENMSVEKTTVNQETPFDRLEARIDIFIERYEQLRSEHSRCSEHLEMKEARIRELEAQLEYLERQKSEVRNRLDALIQKISHFS